MDAATEVRTPESASTKYHPGILLYEQAELAQYGLSEEAFLLGWTGYQRLLEKGSLPNGSVLTICDFSQSSRNKRLYIIDMVNGRLERQTWVAHGRHSGNEYARSFSNRPESWQSSLGFYVTDETYTGSHGLSLRIRGQEPGINDQAYARSIVIHGAAYVDASRIRTPIGMGRSFGCPAVPQAESVTIIQRIKQGTCLFIYHPDRNYQKNSTILND